MCMMLDEDEADADIEVCDSRYSIIWCREVPTHKSIGMVLYYQAVQLLIGFSLRERLNE